MRFLLGLGIYGAGNIGEDLQLGGFIDAISTFQLPRDLLFCAIPYSLKSQKLRFPQIDWFRAEKKTREELISHCDAWIGVGDTPFQITSGLNFLRYLKQDTDICKRMGKPIFMICTGVEQEAEEYKDDFGEIIKNIEAITTRDKASANIIKNSFGCNDANVVSFADLANISLQRIFKQTKNNSCKYDLGWTVNTDSLNEDEVYTIKDFIDSLSPCKKVFICNEVRELEFMERTIYKKYFQPRYKPFRFLRQALFIPNYNSGSIEDLTSIYGKCRRVITTRYHGLLSAAWAGCEVAAIARSSKVKNLAKILGVPYAEKPIKLSELQDVYRQATKVPRSKLDALAQKAADGVKYLWEQGLNDLLMRSSKICHPGCRCDWASL